MYAVVFANYTKLLATETLVARNCFRIITVAFNYYVAHWFLWVRFLYHPNNYLFKIEFPIYLSIQIYKKDTFVNEIRFKLIQSFLTW